MKRIILFLSIILLAFGIVGCKKKTILDQYAEEFPKNDIYYQIFVRSFADSNDDGVGDLNGIVNKLDYFTNLGVTALWLSPIHPTISYHGYEISDYYQINPEFGTMADFEHLVDEAKKRNIKIIMDTVFNHAADNNVWYLDALNNLDSEYRDFFIWPTNAKEGTAAFETFPSSRDLNLKSEKVITELTNVLRFYLEKGVAGFRFDAVKHFFSKPYDPNYVKNPNYEGGKLLRTFKQALIADYPDVYFVGENFEYSTNMNEDYYLGADSMFNFVISQYFQTGEYSRLQLSLQRIYSELSEFNPKFIDAPFITNHDMNRFASMQPNLTNQKLASSILLTLPGNPYIYYGEELGMKGRRIEGGTVPGYVDDNGKPITTYDEPRRQPFLWDLDDSALTNWFPLIDGNDSVERLSQQKNNPNSLYNHYVEMIKVRRENPALMYGNSFIRVDGISSAVAFIRQVNIDGHTQILLIIHNLTSNEKEVNFDVIKDIYGTQLIPPMGTYIGEISSVDKAL
ncbi:MAG: alpha-amylase family glycosyl hydrolase [Acholeplasmataceae bacterium]|jgi:glycosidase